MGEDNASGALKFAIGLVITMIFIGIIVVAFTFGRTHANNAITTMSKDASQIEESRYTQYDGATITGAELINLIEKFEDDPIAIGVTVTATSSASLPTDGGAVAGTTYVRDASGNKIAAATEAQQLRDAKTSTKPTYITPSAQFYGVVNRDTSTDAIKGISFYRIAD